MLSVYQSLDKMDHAPSKSTVRRWLDKVTGLGSAGGALHSKAKMTALAMRSGLEGAFTGAALGALDAELANGLDFHKVPIDAAVGVGGLAVAVLMSDEEYAQDACHVGAASLAVFSFRQSKKFLAGKKLAAIPSVAGEFSGETDDPILRAARRL